MTVLCIGTTEHKLWHKMATNLHLKSVYVWQLITLPNDATVFTPLQTMPSKMYWIFVDNCRLCLSEIVSKFNWVFLPQIFLLFLAHFTDFQNCLINIRKTVYVGHYFQLAPYFAAMVLTFGHTL